MPSIAFHFNAPGKLAYACRLLRKAVAAGSTVAVVADEPTLGKLDEQLWSFSALDFVPHGSFDALTPEQRLLTPIWLCRSADQGQGRQVLVNLLPTVSQGLEAFERVIEIVSNEEADKQSARVRWKHYTEQGHEIVRHDLKLAPSP
jgi:DNA polymerase III subunit chi